MTYKTKFGFLNFINIWTIRLTWTFILVMAIINFDGNKTGLSILIIVALIILVSIKSEELKYDGNIIYLTIRYLYDVVPITNEFRKDEIEEIKIDGNRTKSVTIFMNLLPILKLTKIKNTLQIELKNTTIQSFKTDIFLEELNAFKGQLDC